MGGLGHVAGVMPIPARVVAAVAGAGLVAAGAVAVFVTANSVGAAALVVAGAAVGLLAMFADRIQSFEGGGVKVQLQAAAAATFQAADQAEEAGDLDLAAALRDKAHQLISAVKPISAEYEDVRSRETVGSSRTAKMEQVVRQAREMASAHFVDAKAVERLFESGSDGNRISAIVIMQANPDVASARIIAGCLKGPRSNFELYHALRAAETLVQGEPHSVASREVREAVQHVIQTGRMSEKSDGMWLARRIVGPTG